MTVQRCGATTRAGDACTQSAGWGTDHAGFGRCKLHGGSSPGGRKQGQRMALEEAVQALGIPVDHDPVEGLLSELAQTMGELVWLRDLIRAKYGGVDEGPGMDGMFYGVRSYRVQASEEHGTTETTERGPGLPEELKTYERWKRAYRELVTVALAHGIAERQIEVAEREAETLGQLVAAALDAAGVEGPARALAIGAARDRFTALHGRSA